MLQGELGDVCKPKRILASIKKSNDTDDFTHKKTTAVPAQASRR